MNNRRIKLMRVRAGSAGNHRDNIEAGFSLSRYLTAIGVAMFGWISAFGWITVRVSKVVDRLAEILFQQFRTRS